MSCNHPNKAFWTGCLTETGKKDLIICPGTFGDRLNVKFVKRRIGPAAPLLKEDGQIYLVDPISIPCGSCIGCRLERSRQWSIRLVHECADHENVFFVTLTYRDENLPMDDGVAVLEKDAISKFMKRLRTYTGRRYRFFGCGEYSPSGRPHYHLIIFGDLALGERYKLNAWHSPDITKAWPFGLHEVSLSDFNTISYVTGYVLKKQKLIADYDGSVPPYVAMSTHPALGSSYVKKITGSSDFRVYGDFGSSHSAPIPRAYKKKLENESWYKDYQSELVQKGKSAVYDQSIKFGTNIEDLQGFLKDFSQFEYLRNRRKENYD